MRHFTKYKRVYENRYPICYVRRDTPLSPSVVKVSHNKIPTDNDAR